jgi:hydrogenase-4 component F
MSIVLLLVVATPLAAIAVSLVAGHRASAAITAVSGAASFGLVIALAYGVPGQAVRAAGVLRADSLSVVFALATSFLYVAVGMYSIGYLGAQARAAQQSGGADAADFARYSRRFHVGINIFAWSMLCAPLVDGLALLWIAIEITTVVSALLVAIDDTDRATEAAWKYVLIASSGLGIALLATIFMYYAGAHDLGQSYDLAFGPLIRAAQHLPATPVRLSFVLAVVGFGTKVGLFPMHTWLPDAHAEAPTPVSALLSGSLLTVSFYAILRFYQVAVGTLGPRFPQLVLLVFGVASLLLAALYVLDQHDIKRLLAYSSVEHMGILAIGVSFGAPLALAGVLLHVLAHAAAKGNAFMGAGVLARSYGTKSLAGIRGAMDRLPWTGPLFLVSILALSAMPPFGIFRSEFEIVAGGLEHARYAGAAILVALVTLAFLGLGLSATRILFFPAHGAQSPPRTAADGDTDGAALAASTATLARSASNGRPADDTLTVADALAGHGAPEVTELDPAAAPDEPQHLSPPAPDRGELSAWMVVPVLAGTAVLLVLGLHPPGALTDLLGHGAVLLGGRP